MIRIAGPEDLSTIQLIANEAFSRYVAAIGRKPAPMTDDFNDLIKRRWLYVSLADNGDIQGYVVCEPLAEAMHLENIAVSENYRGQGIGKQLISFCEKHATTLGYDAVELYTNEKMVDNIKMYAHLGYAETGRRHDSGYDRVYFRKTL